MTLKIERTAQQGFTVLALSGRIEPEHVLELKEILELENDCRTIVIDLKDLKLADREAVRFLARCEADGMKLENCPAYIREWMEREKDSW